MATAARGLPCAWYAPTDAYFSRVFLEIARQYAATIRRDLLFPLAAQAGAVIATGAHRK